MTTTKAPIVYPKEWFEGLPASELSGNYWFTLPEVIRFLDINPKVLRRELASGRLVAEGVKDGRGGYHDVMIKVSEFIRWAVETETGQRYYERAKLRGARSPKAYSK